MPEFEESSAGSASGFVADPVGGSAGPGVGSGVGSGSRLWVMVLVLVVVGEGGPVWVAFF